METDLGVLGIEIQAMGFDEVMDNLDRLFAKSQRLQKEFRVLHTANTQTGLSKSRSGLGAGAAKSTLADLVGLGESVAGDLNTVLGSAFDQFIFGGKEAKSILKSLEKDLMGLGSRYFTGKTVTGSSDLFSSVAGVAGNYLTDLFPGFASGGQFTVGGAAGRDRNLVGLRLSRGERVKIETPAQQKAAEASGPQQTINMSFQINTPDADSFRRSQSQIQSDALLSARRILKRNG